MLPPDSKMSITRKSPQIRLSNPGDITRPRAQQCPSCLAPWKVPRRDSLRTSLRSGTGALLPGHLQYLVAPARCASRCLAHLDTATSRRLGLPLLLWRRGLGRGGRHAGRQLLPLSATAFVPLSPRSAGEEREEHPVAVSRCAHPCLAGHFWLGARGGYRDHCPPVHFLRHNLPASTP